MHQSFGRHPPKVDCQGCGTQPCGSEARRRLWNSKPTQSECLEVASEVTAEVAPSERASLESVHPTLGAASRSDLGLKHRGSRASRSDDCPPAEQRGAQKEVSEQGDQASPQVPRKSPPCDQCLAAKRATSARGSVRPRRASTFGVHRLPQALDSQVPDQVHEPWISNTDSSRREPTARAAAHIAQVSPSHTHATGDGGTPHNLPRLVHSERP